jgi:hypothetical protein
VSGNLDVAAVLAALGLPANASLDQVKKLRRKNAQHSTETDDWGTDQATIEVGRRVMGRIELDICSSDYWNYWTVKADRFFDARADVLKQRLVGKGFGNPPGGKVPNSMRSLPKAVWEHVVEHWRSGDLDGFFWVGFSLEQLCVLQASPAHPLQFWTMVLPDRITFLTRGPNGGPPIAGDSPTHGNYLTLLHTQRSPTEAKAQAMRFRDEARRLGAALVRPLG